MKNNTFNFKEFIKGLLIILSYFIVPTIIYMPFYFLLEKKTGYQVTMILTYLVVALLYSYIYRTGLKRDLKTLKENYKIILATTIKYWIIGIILMIISSNIITLLGIMPNTNQETNIEILKNAPIAEIICAIFLAPLIEELVYRYSLRKCTNNKHIYAILTGMIFGLVHVISSIKGPNDLIMFIYIIPFSAVGIAFGYAYHKTDNIYGTMIMHSIHNAISLLQIIIIGGLI